MIQLESNKFYDVIEEFLKQENAKEKKETLGKSKFKEAHNIIVSELKKVPEKERESTSVCIDFSVLNSYAGTARRYENDSLQLDDIQHPFRIPDYMRARDCIEAACRELGMYKRYLMNWQDYTKDKGRLKYEHDVMLHDGTIIPCMSPNANAWYAAVNVTAKINRVTDDEVKAIRLSRISAYAFLEFKDWCKENKIDMRKDIDWS